MQNKNYTFVTRTCKWYTWKLYAIWIPQKRKVQKKIKVECQSVKLETWRTWRQESLH